MKRKPCDWPILLQDGGWREQKRRGKTYWPVYVRRRWNEKQEVRLVVNCWVLFRNGNPQGASKCLDEALLAGEVAT